MPEPVLFWLTVILFSAAVVVGGLALATAIRLKAMHLTRVQEEYPGTADA
jgi:hypothetical protein